VDAASHQNRTVINELLDLTAILVGAILSPGSVNWWRLQQGHTILISQCYPGPTAKARQLLRQSGNTFSSNDGGFSDCYQIYDGTVGFGITTIKAGW